MGKEYETNVNKKSLLNIGKHIQPPNKTTAN